MVDVVQSYRYASCLMLTRHAQQRPIMVGCHALTARVPRVAHQLGLAPRQRLEVKAVEAVHISNAIVLAPIHQQLILHMQASYRVTNHSGLAM